MRIVISLVLILFLLSCSDKNTEAWHLEWSDEFNDGILPDTSVWTFEDTAPYKNAELQYYVAGDTSLSRIEKGCMVLEAKYRNDRYESASIYTLGKKSFKYGRVEAMIKLPEGKGVWPAFWMLGEDIYDTGWPDCGEIDIMEFVGFQPDRVYANIHCQAYNHIIGNNRGDSLDIDRASETFHLYAMEWSAAEITFFIDDIKVYAFQKESNDTSVWPFDTPHYLILNFAVGGNWAGRYGVDRSAFPQQMLVDYVRYYKLK